MDVQIQPRERLDIKLEYAYPMVRQFKSFLELLEYSEVPCEAGDMGQMEQLTIDVREFLERWEQDDISCDPDEFGRIWDGFEVRMMAFFQKYERSLEQINPERAVDVGRIQEGIRYQVIIAQVRQISLNSEQAEPLSLIIEYLYTQFQDDPTIVSDPEAFILLYRRSLVVTKRSEAKAISEEMRALLTNELKNLSFDELLSRGKIRRDNWLEFETCFANAFGSVLGEEMGSQDDGQELDGDQVNALVDRFGDLTGMWEAIREDKNVRVRRDDKVAYENAKNSVVHDARVVNFRRGLREMAVVINKYKPGAVNVDEFKDQSGDEISGLTGLRDIRNTIDGLRERATAKLMTTRKKMEVLGLIDKANGLVDGLRGAGPEAMGEALDELDAIVAEVESLLA